jgi:hypothetical protein
MQSKRPLNFKDLVAALTGSYDAPLWVIFAWFLGGLISDTIGELTSDSTLIGISLRWVVIGLLILILTIICIISRLRRRPVIEMHEHSPVGKHGLILLVSTINPRDKIDRQAFDDYLKHITSLSFEQLQAQDFELLHKSNLLPPLRAIEFHYTSGKLRDCWLIATTETDGQMGSEDVPPLLEKWFRVLHPHHNIEFHYGKELCVHPRDYVSLWNLVDRLFREAPYKPKHIIADVTSGTKLMSVGVALACQQEGRTMQYMSTQRDWRGEPLPTGEMVPILVDIDPYLQWDTSI